MERLKNMLARARMAWLRFQLALIESDAMTEAELHQERMQRYADRRRRAERNLRAMQRNALMECRP